MNQEQFVQDLQSRLSADVDQLLFVDVFFVVNEQAVKLQPSTKSLEICGTPYHYDEGLIIDATTWSLLYDLLTGTQSVPTAFISNEIKTNGYLPQVFTLKLVFQADQYGHIPE